jgi:aryl-alcohol dehydrogenase-like predicted oxidoreductase
MTLGRDGLAVSAVGLGCMGMTGSYGDADGDGARRTIAHALELGINLFDTGDFYGRDGDNERLVGGALRDRRDDVVIATKTGVIRLSDGSLHTNGHPEYLREACDRSLARLDTDRIDIYYLARVDPAVPIEESIGAMGELVDAGKVRGIGLSEVSAETLRRAHAVHPVTALQTEYSLSVRHVEAEILPACRRLGVGFVAYSPLGRGLLAGAIRSPNQLAETDIRRHFPRFGDGNLEANLRAVAVIEEIAGRRGATAAQVALAWVLAQGSAIVALPGTKRAKYVEENAGALELDLSADEIARLELAGRGIEHGERYGEAALRQIDGA